MKKLVLSALINKKRGSIFIIFVLRFSKDFQKFLGFSGYSFMDVLPIPICLMHFYRQCRSKPFKEANNISFIDLYIYVSVTFYNG